jgi:tRNA-dihydrouridine synthase B
MKNIWENLKKPIYALAPLAGLTDQAFRQICIKHGADLTYSEMASATALVYNPEKTLELLEFSNQERPYIVQLFGSQPEHFAIAAQLVTKEIEPDGIDINFGCPVPKVLRQGAGAALMKDLDRSYEVIKAVIDNTDLPVSIKVRTEAGKVTVIDLLKKIQDLKVAAVVIHGRTLAQGFEGPIDTKIIKKARQYFKGVILANGGVNCLADGQRILAETEADGLAIGRGAIGNPKLFKYLKRGKEEERNFENIRKVALEHAYLAWKIKGKRGILEMRKILLAYLHGLPGGKRYKDAIIKAETFADVKKIFK